MYDVIHSCHRLLALKKLNNKGLLTEVVGTEKKLVICYIVGTNCSIMANYSALRGNDLRTEAGVIIAGLREEYNSLQFWHDDLVAVIKLELASRKFVQVESYFETVLRNCKPVKNASAITKGGTVQVPHNMVFK